MSGRVSKLARHRRPSVARRAVTSRTLSSHHLIPSCSAAYPHHRRHLSKRAVFGSSFDAHAVIAPPRRTPGKNALSRPRIMTSHQGIHPNAPPHDKQDEAKDRTRGWRAVPLVASPRRASLSRCPVLLVVSVAVPPHIARRGFHPGEAAIPGGSYIPRRFPQLTTSAPYHRLIASSIPPHPSNSPPLNPGKQARQGRGAPQPRHRIHASSRHRIAPPRPFVSACGAKGVSFLSATPRFTRLATRRHFFSVETRAGKE